MSAFLYRLARTCFRRRLRVLAIWLALLAIIGTLALTVGGAYNDGFSVPGASSSEALKTLAVTFPEVADASAIVVVSAPAGQRVTDPSIRNAMDDYLNHLTKLPFVKGARSPYTEQIKGLISADGTHAMIRVRVTGQTSTFTDAQRAELSQAATEFTTLVPGSTVNVGGDVYAINMPHISAIEALGVVVAIVVLIVTLGGLLAAAMPIATALWGVALGVALVQIAAGIMDVNSTTLILVVMLALAVGIDYALFIISRHRNQMAAGMDVEESAARAVATSGSAVCFAGGTVVIALVGLSIANLPFLTVMGVFGAVGVAVEVCLALTLLPAFFGFAGGRLRPRRRAKTPDGKTQNGTVPPTGLSAALDELPATAAAVADMKTTKGGGPHTPAEAGFSIPTMAAPAATTTDMTVHGDLPPAGGPPTAATPDGLPSPEQHAVPPTGVMARVSRFWVNLVTKKPLITIIVVVLGMGALALPAQGLEMGLPNSGRSVPGTPDRITFDLITKEFGVGANGPLVVTGSIVESDDPLAILNGLRADIEAMPGVAMVAAATPNENADTAMVQVIPTTGPDDPHTFQLVEALRAKHDTWKTNYSIDTAVTGLTAAEIDVTARLGQALLPFGIFVVGLSFILLTMAFRSIWVPVKATLGYLLSIGAAFGLTTLVFNEGVDSWIVNLPEPVPVISFLPIILMGILFGLSMDYEVFLTSRMREEHVHGNPDWVYDGFVHSSKVVVAAACIMFSVFAFFVPVGIGIIKPIAFALAVGVGLDAFVVRMTLGPAVMKLMGERAWWLPGRLERLLPVLDVEGAALSHQTRFANWPSPDDRSAIYARGLRAVAGDRVLLDGVDVGLPAGDVLVVKGSKVARLALAYGLSGRATFDAGEAKVLGHVLPEEGAVVRVRAPILRGTTPDLGRELRRARGGLVFVPAAEELRPKVLQGLLDDDAGALTTWVLGVPDGSDPATLTSRPTTVLEMTAVAADGRALFSTGSTSAPTQTPATAGPTSPPGPAPIPTDSTSDRPELHFGGTT